MRMILRSVLLSLTLINSISASDLPKKFYYWPNVKIVADKASKLGAKDPIGLAQSIHTKRLCDVLLAQAIVESLGDKNAIGAVGEKGAWQVKPEDWGKVPNTLQDQADQAELILESLVKETKSLRKGIKRYNGSGKRAEKYMKKVIKIAYNS